MHGICYMVLARFVRGAVSTVMPMDAVPGQEIQKSMTGSASFRIVNGDVFAHLVVAKMTGKGVLNKSHMILVPRRLRPQSPRWLREE